MSDEDAAGRSAAPARTNLMPPWQPGQSGNPGGVPRGRAKLHAGFINDLNELWEKRGKLILAEVADTDPAALVKAVASLLPKDVQISAKPLEELSDDDIRARIAALESLLGSAGVAFPAGATIEGEATRVVPALPEAAAVPRGGEGEPRAAADGRKSGRKDPKRGR